MSDQNPEYQSKLQRRAGTPIRGMGSGYAQNQAMAGAPDPNEAARLAKMTPEEAQEEAERQERLQAELDNMREDIQIALENNQWTPDTSSWPHVPSSPEEWKELLDKQPAGIIQDWHKRMNEAVDNQIDEEDEEALKESIQSIASLDPDDPLYDPLTDKARKRSIEENLQPLDFEEMVWKGSCTQEIETRPGFKVTFRTLSTQHGLWLEYWMSQREETSYQHTRHLFSLIQVAACLEAVNGKSVGADMTKYVRHEQREEYLKALEERLEFLGKMPGVISDDLIVQFVWFTGRVRKLLAGDLMKKVGNS